MALHWDISNIKNYKKVCWSELPADQQTEDEKVRLTSVTDCLIWLTMIVGISQITEKNAAKFYARVRAWEHLYGPMQNSGDILSIENIRDHIGLRTNASEYSDAVFNKRLVKESLRIGEDQYRSKVSSSTNVR